MARSRNRKPYAASSTPPRYTPTGRGVSLPVWQPLQPFRPYPSLYRNTRSSASPSVLPPRTVRRYLIRTVRTDTTSRRQSLPSRRPSPDIPNRSLDRSNPWNTLLDRQWPVLSDKVPLQRAVTCARRSIRREVLLALSLANGSGSRGVPKSKVQCSR